MTAGDLLRCPGAGRWKGKQPQLQHVEQTAQQDSNSRTGRIQLLFLPADQGCSVTAGSGYVLLVPARIQL